MTTRFTLEMPEELLARVDEARGDVARNRWIRRQIECVLAWEGRPVEIELKTQAREALDALSADATVRDAADALVPVVSRAMPPPDPDRPRPLAPRRSRSSAQAKRDVKPMPKKGK